MTILRTSLIAVTLLSMQFAGGQVEAQASTTASAVLSVSATVASFCGISALPLGFGNYNQVVLAAASSVTIICTSGTTYNVGLDIGTGTGASVASRKMAFGPNLLGYGLFSDSSHSVQWGPTIGTNTVLGTANGLAQILSVYGQIPAAQAVAPGLYTDTVTATVTY